jgi:hypothetical protein
LSWLAGVVRVMAVQLPMAVWAVAVLVDYLAQLATL